MASVRGKRVRYYDCLTGRQRMKTCTTPKAAEDFKARQEQESKLYRDGYLDSDQLRQSRLRIEPIRKVLELFAADLEKRQVTDDYRKGQLALIEKAICGMAVQVVRDLSIAKVAKYLQGLVKDGKSANTHNHSRAALADFCRWLVIYEYLPKSPMDAIRKMNESRDRRRVSRALTVAEVDGLIATQGGHFAAARRRALYLFRVRTGLRVREAARVRWSDVDISTAVLSLRPEITKNRKAETLPLSDDVLEALVELQREALKRGRSDMTASIFGPVPYSQMWLNDLDAAGIERTTEEGIADQKCLRKTASAFLLRAGVDPIDTLLVMRHKPPAGMDLTLGVYGDETALLERKRKAVERVSAWLASERKRDSLSLLSKAVTA